MSESEAATIMTKSISRGVEEDKSNQWGPPISVTCGMRGEQRVLRRCQAKTGKREKARPSWAVGEAQEWPVRKGRAGE